MKRLLFFFFLCIAALCARPAYATLDYSDGSPLYTLSVCPDFAQYPQLETHTGYLTDSAIPFPFPKTGQISYVHAFAQNLSPCYNDAIGFEFFLPAGASLAISVTNPVVCILRDKFPGTYSVNVACPQTASTGTYGGLFFGNYVLNQGCPTAYPGCQGNWSLEMRVPVEFNKKLTAGAAGSFLTVYSVSAYGTPTPFQTVTVPYQADFENFASSGITSSSANLAFTLKSYYHAGSLYIDYGTTNPPPLSVSPASVLDTFLSYPITLPLTGLNASTTYYWRTRFVTSDGTFSSPVQSFTTTGVSTQSLTVSKTGTGTGTVTSSPAGISCGATCSASFASGSSVTLTASPATGSTFSGWSGGCTGTGSCVVAMSSAQSRTATFAASASSYTLTVSKIGTGTGTVTSSPAGINCGATCSASFATGTTVSLFLNPATGSTFSSWGGACLGLSPQLACVVTMNSAQSVTTTFTRQIGSLSVTLDGLPAGSIVTLGITGPDGFSTTQTMMTGTGFNWSDVGTGTYTVTPPTVIISGRTYTAPPRSAVVNFGTSPTINIIYSPKGAGIIPILMLLLD